MSEKGESSITAISDGSQLDHSLSQQEDNCTGPSKPNGTCWKDKVDKSWITEEVAGLSKNQQKKFLKKKLMQETRLEKRKEERIRRKAKRAELREAGLPLPKRIRTKHLKDVKYSDFRVVIDLDFYDLMTDNDLRMVLKQVKDCYAENKKTKSPLQLYMTSFCEKYKALFTSLQPGYVNWHVTMESSCYTDVFDQESLVYLTAESENVLETLDRSKVYIIGGLVDHNKHKGLCYDLAKKKGIAHAQLPIGQYIKLSTRKVLTINHVFSILLRYIETQDWKEAFLNVIPKRKGLDELDNERNNEAKEDLVEKDLS